MDKKLEKEIVSYFKPLLYLILRNLRIDFVLVGAGALELQVQDPESVKTLDADIHIQYPQMIDLKNYAASVAQAIDKEFNNLNFKKSNESALIWYIKKTGNIYLQIRQLKIPNLIVYKLTIFGVEISDIAFENHQPEEYFIIGGKNPLKILKIKPFAVAQFRVFDNFIGKYKPNIKEFMRINKIAFSKIVIDEALKKGYTDKEFSTLYFEGLRDFEINKIKKTYRRIELIFKRFKFNPLDESFEFSKGGSSCVTLVYAGKGIKASVDDLNYCITKTLFGGRYLANYDILLYFDKQYTNYPQYLQNTDRILSNINKKSNVKCISNYNREISCRWTWESTPLTNLCKSLYILQSLGMNISIDSNMMNMIRDLGILQTITYHDCILPHDLYVYKTLRHMVYEDGIVNTSLKLNDILFQSFFNSTTIDRNLNSFITFASFETGVCGLIIRLPKGTRCLYYGTDPNKTAYTSEYELLLPIGCMFKVIDVLKDNYVGEYINNMNLFYKLDIYGVEYIQPESNMFPTLSFPNIKMDAKRLIIPILDNPNLSSNIQSFIVYLTDSLRNFTTFENVTKMAIDFVKLIVFKILKFSFTSMTLIISYVKDILKTIWDHISENIENLTFDNVLFISAGLAGLLFGLSIEL